MNVRFLIFGVLSVLILASLAYAGVSTGVYVQYDSLDDQDAAYIIYDALDDSNYDTLRVRQIDQEQSYWSNSVFYNTFSNYDVVVVVGAQAANGLFAWLVYKGVIDEITSPGVYVERSSFTYGKTFEIFAVAGWSAQDTLDAAEGCLMNFCLEDDGGIDYYDLGTAEYFGSEYTDYCSGSSVREYYCYEFDYVDYDYYSCPAGCSSGRCNTCTDACTYDTYRCNPSNSYEVERCYDLNGDGCTEWNGWQNCLNGCSGGSCIDCQNECLAGLYRCNPYDLYERQKCYDSDGDSCTEWTGWENCLNGCSGGSCITCTDACTYDTYRCNPSNSYEVERCYDLNGDGCTEWNGWQNCLNGCSGGSCIDCVCGDNICNCDETCSSCAQDCGVCPPVCGNGVCETGETCSSCSWDCGCSSGYTCVSGSCIRNCQYTCRASCVDDNDPPTCYDRTPKEGYCSGGYICCDSKETECTCDSNSDCPEDYYCDIISGPNYCKPIQYDDECSNHYDYFCEDGRVKYCDYTGKYFEKVLIEDCTGKYEYCDPTVVDGTGSCSTYPNHLDVWVDYADTGVGVNKQPGDKLRLNIYSEQSTIVTISYDTNTFEGSCPNGAFGITESLSTCDLNVKTTAYPGLKEIRVGEKIARVDVIENPGILVITDSTKLGQRFPNEANGVKAVLKQAYANAEEKGIVYDLSWYNLGLVNPFGSFSTYGESLTMPKMLDNAYSLLVAQFIDQRCNGCEDVMMIGDDYVVPHYRRDIPTLKKEWIFWDKKEIENIYTDSPYISKRTLDFSDYYGMFKIDGRYQGKDVLVIVPNGITTQERAEVNKLKQVLIDNDYDPDFTEMDGKESYCVDERWFSKVRGHTLIIIGTEENNNAFKCMPFVSGDVNRDTAFIQPNVWDNDEYSLVINTDDPTIIGGVANLLDSGDIANLKSENAYFFHVGTQYAGYGALILGVGLLAVGSGGVAPVALITIGAVADVVADSSDVADTCVINNEGWGACGGTVFLTVLPYVPSKATKDLLKTIGRTDIIQKFGSNLDFIDTHLTKIMKKFSPDELKRVVNQDEDLLHLSKGSRYIENTMPGGLENFEKTLPNDEKLRLIKKIGKYEDVVLQKGWERYTKNTPLYRGVSVDQINLDDAFAKGFRGRGTSDDLLAHVKIGDHPGMFVSTSKDFNVATYPFATGEGGYGYIFKINPRAKNAIDVRNSLEAKWLRGEVDDTTWELVNTEREVAFLDSIDPQDIEGAWRVSPDGEALEWIQNQNYIK